MNSNKVIFLIFILLFVSCKEPDTNIERKSPSSEIAADYKYYEVSTQSGLNLRREPNFSSLRLSIIPFKYRGVVIQALPKLETIQGANGFWFKTIYMGQEGWLFSGFAKFLTQIEFQSRDSKETEDGGYFMKSDLKNLELDRRAPSDLTFFQNESIIQTSEAISGKKYAAADFEIYNVGLDTNLTDHKYSACYGVVSYNIFRNRRTGVTFVDQEAQNVSVRADISEEFAIGYRDDFLCSCGRDIRYVLYFLHEIPVRINLPKHGDKLGECSPMDTSKAVTALKLDKSNHVIYYRFEAHECVDLKLRPKIEPRLYAIDYSVTPVQINITNPLDPSITANWDNFVDLSKPYKRYQTYY
jgi:hypothetical protein